MLVWAILPSWKCSVACVGHRIGYSTGIAGIPGEIALATVLEAGGQGLLEPPLEIEDVAEAMKGLLAQAGI